MMAEILRLTEAAPATWPTQPAGLSLDAAAIDSGVIWSRIEGWIAHRWGERSVEWIIQGPGLWAPRLRPIATPTFERWGGVSWVLTTAQPAPLGYELDGDQYRVTATVGTTDAPPATILEAYRRLAEYYADNTEDVGRTSITDGDYSFDRSASAMARAMQYSGAADLLRGYRQ